MLTLTYKQRRGQVEDYFDKVAAKNWSQLTSDAPVSGIRATVRAGRDRMRAVLLNWLPEDLSGARILDAGCGTGAFALEAARRGADVVGVDLSPNLVAVAEQRSAGQVLSGSVTFVAGDLLDPEFGTFDYLVSMDALIHYDMAVAVEMLGELGERVRSGMLFTFVPRTPALSLMFAAGRCLPHSNDRAPRIHLVGPKQLSKHIVDHDGLRQWQPKRTERVANGFYTSQALELVRR